MYESWQQIVDDGLKSLKKGNVNVSDIDIIDLENYDYLQKHNHAAFKICFHIKHLLHEEIKNWDERKYCYFV